MKISNDKQPQPLKFVNQKIIDGILKDIKEGAPKNRAAKANGISDRHFYLMLQQGCCDLYHDKSDTLYAKLVQDLAKIELAEIKECRKAIRDNDKSHKGAEWTLEHAYRTSYSNDAGYLEMLERLNELQDQLLNGKSEKVKET